MALSDEASSAWFRVVIGILASVLITGGTAYLAVNSRLIILSEQFRYATAEVTRLGLRQEQVLRELELMRQRQEDLRWRVRTLERALKQPSHIEPEWPSPDR